MKPEYGKVIVGFPGVGKSALAYNNDFVIDLESSLFNGINGEKVDGWEIPYCNVARWLCRCGFIVCVSSHDNVRAELIRKPADEQILVYPSLELKDEWIAKLKSRYFFTKSEKDKRAFSYIEEHYDEAVTGMIYEQGFTHIVINDMGYYLAEMLNIGNWK